MGKEKRSTILLSIGVIIGLALGAISCMISTGMIGRAKPKQNASDVVPIQYGIGAPNDSMGANGDVYVDSTTNDRYVKVDGKWVNTNGGQGDKGDKGEQGDPGVTIVSVTKYSSMGNVDTYRITYSDGTYSTFTVTNGEEGPQGIQGQAGTNGHTPVVTIGANGHFYVDGVDTGVNAQGPKGKDGVTIVSVVKTNTTGNVDTYTITYSDGTTGTFSVTNGKTPVITIGSNGNWYVDGVDTGVTAKGERGENGVSILSCEFKESSGEVDTYTITYSDGTTSEITVTNGHVPAITINADGYWCVDGVSTGVIAKGEDGENGVTIDSIELLNSLDNVDTYRIHYSNGEYVDFTVTNGQNGADGTVPHIGTNGNWWIGETDTGVSASGVEGEDGTVPHIGANGNWWIGETDTGIYAQGQSGLTPHVGDNGNWFIGATDTGILATGDEGLTPHIGDNGNWFIGDNDTGIKAQGDDGEKGRSAYDIYKEIYGYDGTEEEWLEDLANGRLVNQQKYVVEYYDGNDNLLYRVDDIGRIGSTAYVGPEPRKIPSDNLMYQFSGEWEMVGVSEESYVIKYVAKFDACSLGLTIEQGVVRTFDTRYINSNGSVIIPAHWDGYDITEIGARAFYQMTEVKSVDIPATVEWIGYQAFAYTGLIISVIPHSVIFMDNTALEGVDSLYYVYYDGNFDWRLYSDSSNSDVKVFYHKDSIKEVVIGPNVKNVPGFLFNYCTGLEKLYISEGVEEIGRGAFESTGSLKSVSIPESMVFIPYSGFDRYSLEDNGALIFEQGYHYLGKPSNPHFMQINYESSYYYSGEYVLNPNTRILCNLPEDYGSTEVTLPNHLTGISGSPFYNLAYETKKLIIPDNIVRLDTNMDAMYGVEEVVVGKGVTEVACSNLFEGCESLKKATFLGNITYFDRLGDEDIYGFRECYSIQEFNVPTVALQDMPYGFAHKAWANLCDITSGITEYEGGRYWGDEVNPYAVFIEPSNYEEDYPETTEITIHKDCKVIAPRAFDGFSELQTIIFEEGSNLLSLAGCALYDLNITSIEIPSTVRVIGMDCFSDCGGITELELPDSLEIIANGAFWSSGITSITIPASVKIMQYGALQQMDSLQSATINADLYYLPTACFSGASNLTQVTLNNKIRQIRKDSFKYCNSLENITLPSETRQIDKEAFVDCTSLESIYLPDKVGAVLTDAFKNCTSLTSVSIGNRTRIIEANAFRNCNALTTRYYRGLERDRYTWLSCQADSTAFSSATWTYTH